MSRVIGCGVVAVVAWWFAAALNVPVWRTSVPGDRVDIALFAFIGALLLSGGRA